jgi:hypothetical protein
VVWKESSAQTANREMCFSILALESKPLSLPGSGQISTISAEKHWFAAMDRLGYEPFGERLVQEDSLPRGDGASKWLLRAGSALFWSLVGLIVLARAAFFEPGVFDGFDRVAALVRGVTSVF